MREEGAPQLQDREPFAPAWPCSPIPAVASPSHPGCPSVTRTAGPVLLVTALGPWKNCLLLWGPPFPPQYSGVQLTLSWCPESGRRGLQGAPWNSSHSWLELVTSTQLQQGLGRAWLRVGFRGPGVSCRPRAWASVTQCGPVSFLVPSGFIHSVTRPLNQDFSEHLLCHGGPGIERDHMQPCSKELRIWRHCVPGAVIKGMWGW